jgi:hypothetical protein
MTAQTRHFKEEIQELADDRLTPAARVEVEKHLALCEECREELLTGCGGLRLYTIPFSFGERVQVRNMLIYLLIT